MIKWTDYAGYDLVDTEKIKAAKNDEDLKAILNEHIKWLEDLCTDTIGSVNTLNNELFY